MERTERKKLGVGLLGCGWMGRVHSNGYKTARYIFWPKSKWDAELVATCGIDLAEGQAFAERFQFGRAYATYGEMLKDPEVTVFDNVAPDPIHVAPTIAAAKAGKHIVCEKPLAVKASDAKAMYDAAESAGVKHLCCFSYRFMPAVRLAYQLINGGELGKIYHFAGTYYQDQGSFEETPAEQVWYVMGSGVEQGITTHLIDMSRFLLGDIATVHGMSKTYNTKRSSAKGPMDVKATEGFFTMLEYERGCTGMMQSLGVANGKQSEFSFEIFGSKGSLRWDMADPNILYVYLTGSSMPGVRGWTKINATEPDHPFMDVWWPKGHVLGWEHGNINMLAHFLDCIAEDRSISPLGATFKEGWEVASIIETIHRSALEGKKLTVSFE
jgi:predicted dehydrogenase